MCESSPELVELSAIKFFSLVFQKQSSAPEELGKCMHTSYCHRKSDQSIRRHKKAIRDLKVQGFLSLPNFLKLKAISTNQQDIEGNNTHQDEANVMGTACSGRGGTVLALAVFEEDKKDKTEEANQGSMHMLQAEEEEEEEEEEESANEESMHMPKSTTRMRPR